MKKLMALALAAMMLLSLAGIAAAKEKVSITMWTYPIGGWGKSESVDEIIAAFNEKHPNSTVQVE